jgi:hypothetical protein
MLPSNKLFVIKSKFSEKMGSLVILFLKNYYFQDILNTRGNFYIITYYFTNGNIKKIEVLILADRKIRISMITDEVRI